MPKKFKIRLTGTDGNAFALMGRWKEAAKKAKWTPKEIKAVLDEAMKGDYNHLLATLQKHADVS